MVPTPPAGTDTGRTAAGVTPSIHRATRSLAASVRISFVLQVVNVKFNMLCLYLSTSFRFCLFMYFMQLYVEKLYYIIKISCLGWL